jgi:hypothetical protein
MAAKNSCHLYFRYNRINNYPVIRSDENAKGESVRTEAFNAEFVSGMCEGISNNENAKRSKKA